MREIQHLAFEPLQVLQRHVQEVRTAAGWIEHACEKVCACATCHVHLRDGAQFVNAADEDEDDQLDEAWGLDAQSRLACCVKVRGPALVVELPRYSKNLARER